ncbi:MAG: class I SAM-dependent methyltransferase [Anaerolineae bacterium]
MPSRRRNDDDYIQNHWWFASRTRALKAAIERALPRQRLQQRDLRILDVGCGAGNMIHHLSRYGPVKGLEIDPRPVAVAHQRGYDVQLHDVTQSLPYGEASFDLVTALDVIEHNEDDLAILRHIQQVLRPGGHLVITVPALMWLWSHNDEINAHARRYAARELRDKLQQTGFRVRRITFNNFFVFPLAALLILLRRGADAEPELASHHLSEEEYQVEMEPASPPVNAILTLVGIVEAFLIRWIDLPIGTSLIAIAQKE